MSPTDEVVVEPEADDSSAASPTMAPRALLVAALVVGVAVDLMFRSDLAGVAGVVAVLAVVVTVATSRRVRGHRPALVALALGAATSLLLVLRASEWLVPLNALAVVILVFVGAALPSIASWRDLPVAAVALRTLDGVTALLQGPGRLRSAVGIGGGRSGPAASGRARTGAVLRGIGLALPIVAVLCALLASADAVFASFFTSRADPSPLLGHLALAAIGVWCAAAAWWFASTEWTPRAIPAPFRLGLTEAAIVLGSLVAVYGLFVAAQVLAQGADVDHILQTAGLTRAEYARSGFFQLLWAAGLTLLVLLGLHWMVGRDRPTPLVLHLLQLATIGLTMSVLVIAVRRLGLYADAYGLTMLRLYCTVFAWWLGAVMSMTAVYLVHPWRHRWLPLAVGALALCTLVALNLANPERIVAEHNLGRAEHGQDVDLTYLDLLSDDAVPALVAGVDQLPAAEADALVHRLCTRPVEASPWYGANLSSARAAAALAELCD